MPGDTTEVLSEEETLLADLDKESSEIAAKIMAEPPKGTYAPEDAEAAAAALLAKAAEAAGAANNGEGETPEQIAARAEAARAAEAAAGEKTPEQIAAEEAAAETETARLAAEEAAAEAAELAKGPPKRVHLPTHLEEGERHMIQAAASLARAQKISFTEAFARLNPTPAAGSEESAGHEEKVDPIKAKRDELAKVTASLDQMAADRELDGPEKRALLKQERQLEKEIERLESAQEEQNHERVQTAQEKFDTDWIESEKVVAKAFPNDFGKDTSPLTKAVLVEMAEIAKDKTHRLYGSAELPELLYAKHALRMGVASVKPAAPVITPPGASRMLPAPGGAGINTPIVNAATKAAAVAASLKEAAEGMDPEEKMAAILEKQLTGK